MPPHLTPAVHLYIDMPHICSYPSRWPAGAPLYIGHLGLISSDTRAYPSIRAPPPIPLAAVTYTYTHGAADPCCTYLYPYEFSPICCALELLLIDTCSDTCFLIGCRLLAYFASLQIRPRPLVRHGPYCRNRWTRTRCDTFGEYAFQKCRSLSTLTRITHTTIWRTRVTAYVPSYTAWHRSRTTSFQGPSRTPSASPSPTRMGQWRGGEQHRCGTHARYPAPARAGPRPLAS